MNFDRYECKERSISSEYKNELDFTEWWESTAIYLPELNSVTRQQAKVIWMYSRNSNE